MRPISIIVAIDENGGFAKGGKIPWDFPEDFKRFQKITSGAICIMGRKTYDDILEIRQKRDAEKQITEPIKEILPNRTSIVLTRQHGKTFQGAETAESLRVAVENLKDDDLREIFVIGGEKLFIEGIQWAETVYITLVEGNYHCDKFFPMKYFHKYFVPKDCEKSGELKFMTYKRTGDWT